MERKDVIKMDTIIQVKCIDQTLTLINSPVIASGGLNENKLECEFCEKWDGFSKTAVFYQDKKNVYYSVLDENDTCIIPKEATASKGTMCFGIFGSKGDVTRTSEVLRYKIDEGAITDDLKPSDPTPDIYEQLLAKLQEIREAEATFEEDITKQQNTFESNITKQQDAFEEDITNKQTEISNQWATYKTDLTNQQNTFEANITKKENDFEDSTTDKLDKYESEIEDIASSAVTKAQISKEITLTTTWTQDSTNGYYTQNVTIDGIKITDMPTLDIKLTGNADNMKAINKEWAKILSAETYDGGIKFYAKSVTTKELTIIVKGSLSKVNIDGTTEGEVEKYFGNVFVKKANVIDNLNTSDIDKPLSANQGMILDTKIKDNTNDIANLKQQVGRHIYGFKIIRDTASPNDRVEYTDDCVGFTPMKVTSSGTDYGSWKEFINQLCRPVMLRTDGTVDYELDHEDTTKKYSGGDSDISNADYNGNAMVEFSTFRYISRQETDTEKYIRFANYKADDTFVDYAFIGNDGELKNCFYYSMFMGSVVNDKMRSLADQTIATRTAKDLNRCANNNGSNYLFVALQQNSYIIDILRMLGKSTNIQDVFGYGAKDIRTATGATKDKGCFYMLDSTTSMKALWIEDIWSKWFCWCNGCVSVDKKCKIKTSAPYPAPSDSDVYSEYTEIGSLPSSGDIKDTYTTNAGLLPKTTGGSSTTYYCDYIWLSVVTETRIALINGHWGNVETSGSSFDFGYKASNRLSNSGSRLMYI